MVFELHHDLGAFLLGALLELRLYEMLARSPGAKVVIAGRRRWDRQRSGKTCRGGDCSATALNGESDEAAGDVVKHLL